MLEKHLDVHGDESERVLQYGYMNSYYQTGLKNLMDEAILKHGHLEEDLKVKTNYHKIDEILFDFQRRRMSVIVENNQNQHILICKGAVEEIMRLSPHVEVRGEVLDVTPENDDHHKRLVQDLNALGFRVVAVAYKVMPGDNDEPHYEMQDESGLTLLCYLAFLDPSKDSAMEALKRLKTFHHRLSGCLAHGFTAGKYARICNPPASILAAAGGDVVVLHHLDPVGENLVLS